jgi:hypothetical protein
MDYGIFTNFDMTKCEVFVGHLQQSIIFKIFKIDMIIEGHVRKR